MKTAPKFDAIVHGAAQVFAHVGYKRAMMEDVAQESGVALGTLYRYVDTKEQLFELALRRSLGEPSPWSPDEARRGRRFAESIFELARSRLSFEKSMPELAAAVERASPVDATAELERIAGAVYDALDRYHLAIRMLDRSSAHWPELSAIFADELRAPLVRALTRYLERRCAAGALRKPPNIRAAARMVLELLVTHAMHRRFSPGGEWTDDDTARETALYATTAMFGLRSE